MVSQPRESQKKEARKDSFSLFYETIKTRMVDAKLARVNFCFVKEKKRKHLNGELKTLNDPC